MKSLPPFFFMAFYNWLVESNQNPMIHVIITNDCKIPKQFMNQDRINFNVSPAAVNNLFMDDKGVSFDARFNQAAHSLYIPFECIEALSCKDIGFIIKTPFIPHYQESNAVLPNDNNPTITSSDKVGVVSNSIINGNNTNQSTEIITGRKVKHLTVVK